MTYQEYGKGFYRPNYHYEKCPGGFIQLKHFSHSAYHTEGERMNAIATRGITSYAELVAKQATIHVAANVTVSWAWYDQANGVVVWKFQNSDTKQHSVVLLRNGYYFGGA